MAGLRLLGFAMPSAGSSGTYAALSGFLPAENYFSDGETLFARTATPIETRRVEHFSFADDVGESANGANPDSDALNNLGEYAQGGNPTNAADIGYLPVSNTVVEGGTNFFEYVYARRTTPGHGMIYTVESSSNLLSNDWKVGTYITLPTTGNLDGDDEAVTNRINTSGRTNGFIGLRIDALSYCFCVETTPSIIP